MMITKAPSVIQMGREELANLLTSVDETLATDLAFTKTTEKRKSFGTLQLWNIRRKARYNGVRIR